MFSRPNTFEMILMQKSLSRQIIETWVGGGSEVVVPEQVGLGVFDSVYTIEHLA
jgi:hypothetical protein